MLTSSDAKWRCLWHLFIWSLLLTFVSQLLRMQDHVAFYIFASCSIITLPILTAIYSNTSGRKGSGLLRVAYVLMDPVMACMTITPIKLVHHLPVVMDKYACTQHADRWNTTEACLHNASLLEQLPAHQHSGIVRKQRLEFLVLQCSIPLPTVLALLMCRRSRKMLFTTHLLVFVYWFLSALETMTLLQDAMMWEGYKHMVHTTAIMVSVVTIIANSYAVVTLISFISPPGLDQSKHSKFDLIYRVSIGITGAFFVEIPLLVARFQMAVADPTILLPVTFYFWMAKDFLFIIMTILIILVQRFGTRLAQISCKPTFDEKVFFKPEKRDVYIQRVRRVRFKEPLVDHGDPADVKQDLSGCEQKKLISKDDKDFQNKEIQEYTGDNKTSPCDTNVNKVETCDELASEVGNSLKDNENSDLAASLKGSAKDSSNILSGTDSSTDNESEPEDGSSPNYDTVQDTDNSGKGMRKPVLKETGTAIVRQNSTSSYSDNAGESPTSTTPPVKHSPKGILKNRNSGQRQDCTPQIIYENEVRCIQCGQGNSVQCSNCDKCGKQSHKGQQCLIIVDSTGDPGRPRETRRGSDFGDFVV